MAGLEIPVHLNTTAMFSWTDRWLHGTSLEELAPSVFKSVPLRVRKTRTVAEALVDHSWVSDIIGALSWHGLMEYLELWDAISDFQLNNTEDQHHWKFESSGFFFPLDQPIEYSLLGPFTLNHGNC